MNLWFFLLTVLFIIVSASMVLIILVQRPQGGGLAGAFGGAGGGSTESVFGGRVGDALTFITVGAFAIYLLLAIILNKIPIIVADGDLGGPEDALFAIDPVSLVVTSIPSMPDYPSNQFGPRHIALDFDGVVPVPEPTALLLGLAGLAAVTRRSRRSL